MTGLYLVTDRSLIDDPSPVGGRDHSPAGGRDRSLEELVAAAIEGGVSSVQLREKDATTREFVAVARRIKALCASLAVPLIINDRVDVALAVNADGVHLGQDDLSYADARALLGPDAIIGVSVETMDDVARAEPSEAAYLGVSPIFATPTKPDTRGAWGLDGLRQVRRRSRHRLVAIGGLNAGNAGDAIAAGADAVAVVSAICGASDPREAAAQLRRAIDEAASRRTSQQVP